MKPERWHLDLRKGALCAVEVPSAPDALPTYGYARLLDDPQGPNVVVRLHQHHDPIGQVGTIPLALILVEMSAAQFDAARRCGYPAEAQTAMVFTNQITNQYGKA